MKKKNIPQVRGDDGDDIFSYLLEDELEKNKYFLYTPTETIQKTHNFYLNSEFEEPHRYSKMFYTLSTARSDEAVQLHINTRGGQLNTGVQLINNILTCPAPVTAIIEAECHSLGAFIFLAADYQVVRENCVMLLHNYTSGTYGKGNEQEREIKTMIRWFTDLAKNLLIPFLTEEELKRMLQGEDFWMTTKEIRTRLKRVEKQLRNENLNI